MVVEALEYSFKPKINVNEGREYEFAEALFDTFYPYRVRSNSLRFVRQYKALRNNQRRAFLNKAALDIAETGSCLSAVEDLDFFIPLSRDFLTRDR